MTDHPQQSPTYRVLNFISRLPIQLCRFLAHGLGGLVNVFNITKTSENIRLNLRIAFPDLTEQEYARLTRLAVRNELTSYFEFFNIWGAENKDNISRVHAVHGQQLLHSALAENKGLVLIVPHFGTWEIMNAWIAQYTKMTILYKPVKDPGADLFVRNARSREQATLVPTDESGVRQIFRALKSGGTTVILPDHTPNQGGDSVPYFDIPLESSNLCAKLIQKTRARTLLLYALRNDNNGFDMHIELVDDAIYSGTANDGTRVIHHAVEQLIQRYPEHYHWSYKRFRANPQLRKIYDIDRTQALQKVEHVRAEYHSSLEQ